MEIKEVRIALKKRIEETKEDLKKMSKTEPKANIRVRLTSNPGPGAKARPVPAPAAAVTVRAKFQCRTSISS